MNYFKLEIPYSTSILLPIDGSEAFVKYLQRGLLTNREWRDDKEIYVKEIRYGISLSLINTTVQERLPEPELEDSNKTA